MIHIRKFDNELDFIDAYYGGQRGGMKVGEGESWLSYTEVEDEVYYNKSRSNPRNIPLTFKALQDNSKISFAFEGPDDERTREIWYSVNGGSWASVRLGDSGNYAESYQFPVLNTGDTI